MADPRRHDIDALRVFAFALLILYHVAMVYVADWDYHVKSAHQWTWLQWLMVSVNRWRMPLIFMLSGIALGLALARPGSAGFPFALRRTLRLILPLGFGMLAIVPIQAYCEARANGAIAPGFGAFLLSYVQLGPWPADAFTGAEYGLTWNHLWYLAYLWVYTLLLLAVLPLRQTRLGAAVAASALAPAQWRGPLLLIVAPLYFFAGNHWLEPDFPETHALIDDWHAHTRYLAVFLFGFAIARAEPFWAHLDRLRWVALILAAGSLTAFLMLRAGSAGGSISIQVAQAVYLWTALLTILAFGRRWLNRPFTWLPYANEAVYPWYILHQSLIVPLAFFIGPLGLSGPVEAGWVVAGTLLGCAVGHELLIRRAGVLRPLFGLKPAAGCARGARGQTSSTH